LLTDKNETNIDPQEENTRIAIRAAKTDNLAGISQLSGTLTDLNTVISNQIWKKLSIAVIMLALNRVMKLVTHCYFLPHSKVIRSSINMIAL
jgi:hypothetical protein